MAAKKTPAFYTIHMTVLMAQVIFVLVALVRNPSEADSAVFLGYSAEKLLLLSIPLGILLIWIAAVLYFRAGERRLQVLDASLHRILNSRAANILNIFGVVVIVVGLYLLAALFFDSFFILAPHYDTYFVDLIFERNKFYLVQLRPIIALAIGLAVQTIVFSYGMRADYRTWKKRFRAQAIFHILWLYGLLLIFWGLLGWWSRNLEPDLAGYSWYPLGAPILDNDVLVAFLVGLLLIGVGVVGKAIRRPGNFNAHPDRRKRYIDISIGAALWLIAGLVWISPPIEPNWFLDGPVYPNFEYYPGSDALKYDIAGQSMLLGENLLYHGHLMHKPLYAAFLALLHRLAGPGFESVSLLQAAIFGVFPVLIYSITRKLQGRLAGVIAALLIIFREMNAIVSASEITVSHSRQLMTDTPAVIGLLLVIYIVYIWFKKPNHKFWIPVVIGGLIASFMQVRSEILLLLPLVLLFQAYIYFSIPRYWIKTSLIMLASFSVIFGMWQLRAMYLSGQSFLNSSRVASALRYSQARVPEPGSESPSDGGDRFRQMASHLVNNYQQAFLIFPGMFRPVDSLMNYSVHENDDRFWLDCCSAKNYIDRLHSYWEWQKWDGQVPQESLPAILGTLLLVSIGLVRTYKKMGMRALFPLLTILAFYLLFSGFRMSGGRHGQLVDSIWIIYYSIGLAHFAEWVFYFLFSEKAPAWLMGHDDDRDRLTRQGFETPNPARIVWRPVFSAGLIVLVIGAIVPLAEFAIPPQFSESTKQEDMEEAFKLTESDLLSELLANDGMVWQGRAFYPQFIGPEPSGRDLRNLDALPTPNNYLRFSIVGPNSRRVMLPKADPANLELAHAADVLVFGCMYGNIFDALAIYDSKQNRLIFRDPLPETLACPLTTKK